MNYEVEHSKQLFEVTGNARELRVRLLWDFERVGRVGRWVWAAFNGKAIWMLRSCGIEAKYVKPKKGPPGSEYEPQFLVYRVDLRGVRQRLAFPAWGVSSRELGRLLGRVRADSVVIRDEPDPDDKLVERARAAGKTLIPISSLVKLCHRRSIESVAASLKAPRTSL